MSARAIVAACGAVCLCAAVATDGLYAYSPRKTGSSTPPAVGLKNPPSRPKPVYGAAGALYPSPPLKAPLVAPPKPSLRSPRPPSAADRNRIAGTPIGGLVGALTYPLTLLGEDLSDKEPPPQAMPARSYAPMQPPTSRKLPF